MRLNTYLAALVLPLLILTAVAVPAPQALQAQTDERCFSETGFCISGPIRAYWEQNGGLAVFGLPIGPQQEMVGEDGQARQTQWFERHRLELHPENDPPYNVLLGRIGVERLAQQGRDWRTFPPLDPVNADAESCAFFAETEHIVCDEFLTAFRSYGLNFPNTPGITREESLALFGLPISQVMTETIEGQEYQVQWFERARFELHPQNDPPFNVLFGRLGAELNGAMRSGAAALQGVEWQLVQYGPLDEQFGQPNFVVPGSGATLVFEADRVSGSTGCNRFGGPYTATAEVIQFGPLISTLAACTEEALNVQEQAILTTLDGMVPYQLTSNELRLSYDDGRQALVYRAPGSFVNGTLTYRERIALPPDAEIQVQLVDISRADAPATVLSSVTFTANGGQVPFRFALPFDPAQIDERNTYAVQARITVDGELRFITTQVNAVITRGNPTTVEIMLQQV